jgi:hypothetical protein
MQNSHTESARQSAHRLVRWKTCLVPIFVVAALLSAVAGLRAQIAGTASIQGTITDPTNAVVANATITLTNEATQIKHTSVSDSSGVYLFPNVPIGKYDLTVSAAGFKTYQQRGIVLEVGSSIAVNPSLSIGTASQSVEVQAEGLALQTEDATLKSTVDSKTMTEMPLNSRQMTDLVKIQGGAVFANEGSDQTGSKSFFSSQAISITGGQGNATDYRLDGADWNDYMSNVNLPFPFPDAVSEFAVESTAEGAQSGLHPGGLVNVVSKSGTNQLHGDAFEFIRNNYIDADNFFAVTKDSLHQDQFGGTVGGKLITSKLFFFGGYQRLRAVSATSASTATVPTAAEMAGCWSQTYILDPITGVAPTTNAACNSYNSADLYINPTTYSAAALKLAAHLPLSSANQTTGTGQGQVHYTAPSEQFENVYVTREDWTINPNHTLYGRFMWDGYNNLAFYDPNDILVTGTAGNVEHVAGVVIGETWIIRQNLVNSFHAGANRRVNDRGPNTAGVNTSAWGVNMYDTTSVGTYISVGSGSSGFGVYCSKCSLGVFNVNTFPFADDLDWVKGKHEIQFGGEFVRSQFNSNNIYYGNGNIAFNGNYSLYGPSGTGTGSNPAVPMLDFLRGAMSSFSQSKPQQNALRAWIPNLYIQDTYHLTPRIVLTAGVRWDPAIFPTDYFGRGSVFNYNNFLNNVQSSAYVNAPPGVLYYGDPGVPKSYTKNSMWQFSPRLGATWDPKGNGKTVVRAGGAIVYDETNFFAAERQQDNAPFGLTISNTPSGAPLSFDNPWSNGSITTNPFPLPAQPTKNIAFLKNGGYQFVFLPSQFHTPYMMQWTLSVQQQLAHGWQATVDYIGNRTDHGAYGFPLDLATYIPGNWATTGPSSATNCPGYVGSGTAGKACSTTSNYSGRFALTQANNTWGPAYGGGGANGGTGTYELIGGANSSYNGLVATIKHTLSSNLVVMANYTYSHCIDINDNPADVVGGTGENPNNIRMDRGRCGFDFRHVLNATVVASSHLNINRNVNYIVNGWELSSLLHATSGVPFNVTTGTDNSLIDEQQDRPNLLAPGAVYTHNKIRSGPSANAQYIAASTVTSVWQPNALGTFGNVGRNAFNGPKFFDLDAALDRSFPLHERLTLDLRLDSFNMLNHPNFAAPGSSGVLGSASALNSSSFGQITSTLWNASTGINAIPAREFQGVAKITF